MKRFVFIVTIAFILMISNSSCELIFEDIPEMHVGRNINWYSYSGTSREDVEAFSEMQEVDDDKKIYRDPALVGKPISGECFGKNYQNARYEQTHITNEYRWDYYSSDTAGVFAFITNDKGEKQPHCMYFREKPLTVQISEDEAIERAKKFIRENSYSHPNCDLSDYVVECKNYSSKYSIHFRRYKYGVSINSYMVEMDKYGNMEFFGDDCGSLSESVPHYTKDDYLKGVESKINEFYEAKSYDFFKSVTDLKIYTPPKVTYYKDKQTYAISVQVEFIVNYTDGDKCEVNNYFYFPFDPKDYE
ncbi:MAG: hypothetical protein IKY21_03805 [Clostridia bacterium]|nr:hypothetical protein [Clostridia bacterium]